MPDDRYVMEIAGWGSSWAVGAPLIVTSLVVHAIGLGLIRAGFHRAFLRPHWLSGWPLARFVLGMSVTVFLVTLVHVLQAAIWAAALVMTGAADSARIAMLYSIGAMATYGHAAVYLDAHWQMLGALEALNGVMLLGLSTAFLYSMVQQAWRRST